MPNLDLRVVVPLLALVFVLLAAGSARNKSLTWDEPTFITSGYTYLDKSDFRLNPEAPPLLQELVALPIRLGDFRPPNYDAPEWTEREQVRFARDHANRNAGRIRDYGTYARVPVWILGACLVLVGAAFCARLAGPNAGLVCALTMALSPNLLAHGRLATTDFGCAALMFGSIGCLWYAVESGRPRVWALFGLVTGIALLSKYTALLLGPACLLIVVYEVFAGGRKVADLVRGIGIAAGVAVVLLFVGYDLQNGPGMYLAGLDAIYSRSVEGFQFYLLGETSDRPVWYYHFVAFLLKTPEPTILLFAIAVFAVARTPELRRASVYLITPVALVFLVSVFDEANLGLRRILPVYPFLFALIGIAASAKPCRLCTIVYAGLVAGVVLTSALAYPHYLSYFNTLSGGTNNGPYLLDDSNVDWGQDLPALADWQSDHADPVVLRYFGTMEPSLYGVRATRMSDQDVIRPRSDVTYAVSAHNLVHFRKIARQSNRPDVDWLARYQPFERLGGSIYLYRFPQKKLPVKD